MDGGHDFAEEHGFKCTKANVLGLRKECFGDLLRRKPTGGGNSAALEARVLELETRYLDLALWLQAEFPLNKKLKELIEAWSDPPPALLERLSACGVPDLQRAFRGRYV